MKSTTPRIFFIFACFLALLGVNASAQTVNPKTDIRWPASCTGTAIYYNIVTGICTIPPLPTPVVPSGTPDGTLRSFGLPSAPSHPANGQLFNSGSYARYGVDYNISGATIVWIGITPPQVGDNLVYFGS